MSGKFQTPVLEVFLSCSVQATSFKSNQNDFVVSFKSFSNDTIIEVEQKIFPGDSLVGGENIAKSEMSQAIASLASFYFFGWITFYGEITFV